MEEDLPPYLVPHSQEPIRILYRDQHLLIVRKPHLLLSVPGRHRLNKDCLVTRLQRNYHNRHNHEDSNQISTLYSSISQQYT